MKKSFNKVKGKYIKFFEEKGTLLSCKNGEKIPLDLKGHEICIEQKWSENIIVLGKNGLLTGYYRNSDKQFTISGLSIMDLYLKDCEKNLLSKNFIFKQQLEELSKFLKL